METWQIWDAQLFTFINKSCSNSVFDVFLPIMRDAKTWIPLYIFMVGYFLYQYKWKGFYPIGGILLTFALADGISAHLIKPWVQRLRPCRTPELFQTVISRVGCGSGYSFPSSHATNHFAIAVFFMVLLGAKHKWIYPIGFLWAFSISFAQVYVGVHFPVDVTAGAVLGALIGYLVGKGIVKYQTLIIK